MQSIAEQDKLRLVDHVMDTVRLQLSGRDGKDLLETIPSRAIFAGVLQAPRASEALAASNRGDAPAGTALGIDFRIRPSHLDQPVTLKVLPRWSVYYPVFPTYQETLSTNDSIREPSNNSGETSDQTSEDSEESDSLDQSTPTEDATPPAIISGVVLLPRKWRRHNIEPSVASIQLGVKQTFSLAEMAQPELDRATNDARQTILSDPALRRHLGEPSSRERTLGSTATLKDRSAYENALAAATTPVSLPAWSAKILIDVASEPDDANVFRVRILLANATPEVADVPDPGLEERSFFDALLSVEVSGAEVLPFDFWLAPRDYRSDPKLPAKGINCAAFVDSERKILRTETLPTFRQPLYRTRETLEVRFDQMDVDDPAGALAPLATQMTDYLQDWQAFLTQSAPTKLSSDGMKACQADRDAFKAEIEQFQLGVETLRRDARLRKAFAFMNRVFARLASKSGGRVRAWRLFQIGFMVSQLPSLAVRELRPEISDSYADTLRSKLDEVAVLWFPTGGGKTEAYLGLIAVALLYDRLRGKTRGVCAWMRFPLRMLSLQQMERLARVIAALDEFREEEPSIATGDPFAIGYYVGDANTPNSLSDEDMKRYEHNKGLREEVRLLRKCPFCGAAIEIKPLRQSWRLAHVCSNASCFSNTSSTLGRYKGSLPLCIVDNEIYRYLPAVLVGTVDKLAIIARSRYFAHLVRGTRQECKVHGYTSYDECVEKFSGCKATRKHLTQLSPLPDPGLSLLIQDELHLLRAELGVFNGHYEGLLQYLGGRAYLKPKVLAATATIEAYDIQAFHVYMSRARRYPQPSWQQGESFYATSKPESHRRIYLGVLGHTRGIEEPAVRIIALYQREIRRLMANPAEAAAIMDKPDLSAEAVLDLLRLYDLSLCYVNRKSTGGSIVDKLSQVERHFETDKLGSLKSQLLTGDQNIDEIGAALDRIENERADTGAPRLNAVIATNLISHGVDLERINMMTVCGMPSHYAEYVQASSRAARSHPGIVFVCFKARDPRETSQFEFFHAMHFHMERLIEPVAVNRFASFAPRKTVPGLIAGLLLSDLTPDLYGTQVAKPLDHVPTLQIALGRAPAPRQGTQANSVSEDYLRQAVIRIIGVDEVRPPASASQVRNLKSRVNEVFDEQMASIGRSMETQLKAVLNPITSFRDVDEGIDFGSIDSASFVTRLRAR